MTSRPQVGGQCRSDPEDIWVAAGALVVMVPGFFLGGRSDAAGSVTVDRASGGFALVERSAKLVGISP